MVIVWLFHRPCIAGIVGLIMLVVSAPPGWAQQRDTQPNWRLRSLGAYQHSDADDAGAAEIVKYDKQSRALYVVNSEQCSIDILDVSDPHHPKLARQLELSEHGDSPTHVALHGDLVAVSMAAKPITDPGTVAFFDRQGSFRGLVTVGSLPDMLAFTPNGRFVLTADEGEPNDDYDVDPVGTVTRIELPSDPDAAINDSTCNVTTITLDALMDDASGSATSATIRLDSPRASSAASIEPEYLAVSQDGSVAWVVLQENNGLAIVDIEAACTKEIVSLGTKSFDSPDCFGLDASDVDQGIHIERWPVQGMYQPDGIAAFRVGANEYLITANEGDHRKYAGYRDVVRVADLALDPAAFPHASELQKDTKLGRLQVSAVDGDLDGDGLHESLYTFGGRSFAIWDARGELVYDSGSLIEELAADQYPDSFNSNMDQESFDQRSDDKGPEPEGVATGVVQGRTLAFVGLERLSCILVVDVTQPTSPQIEQLYRRDGGDNEVADRGPEGLTFISADDSPNGRPLLAVAYEVSSTTRIYQIEPHPESSGENAN